MLLQPIWAQVKSSMRYSLSLSFLMKWRWLKQILIFSLRCYYCHYCCFYNEWQSCLQVTRGLSHSWQIDRTDRCKTSHIILSLGLTTHYQYLNLFCTKNEKWNQSISSSSTYGTRFISSSYTCGFKRDNHIILCLYEKCPGIDINRRLGSAFARFNGVMSIFVITKNNFWSCLGEILIKEDAN